MKKYEEGAASKAICRFCKRLRDTTFKFCDVPIKSGGFVDNILVAVCDTCEKVIGIPQQSVPQIKEALENNETQQETEGQ